MTNTPKTLNPFTAWAVTANVGDTRDESGMVVTVTDVHYLGAFRRMSFRATINGDTVDMWDYDYPASLVG